MTEAMTAPTFGSTLPATSTSTTACKRDPSSSAAFMATDAPIDCPTMPNRSTPRASATASTSSAWCSRAIGARAGDLAAPSAAQVDRDQLERVAAQPLAEEVEVPHAARQTVHPEDERRR